MPFAVNQQVIQALAPKRSTYRSAKGIRPGRPYRRLDDPHAGAGEHVVEDGRELAVTVADQEPEPGGAFTEVHQQVAGLLSRPFPGGVGGDAQDVYPPCADLHHEEHVQTSEEHGVNVQEIARQDPGGLEGQELPPGRDARRGAGVSPASARIRRMVPSPMRCPRPRSSPWMRRVPPVRVPPGQLPDQLADVLRDLRASGGVRIGPFVLDDAPVPGEQGGGCHDPVQSKGAGAAAV